MTAKIKGADLFCGAGGFTAGFIAACARLKLDYNFVGANHWDVAIATHSINHPKVRHILDDLQKVKPSDVFKGTIEILLASPECTHHSNAAGGVPRNPQSRASAGYVVKWARQLQPRIIIVENVKEFRDWGPLGKNGKPLKRQKGVLFDKWIRMLKGLGYRLEYRILCCANYGDPTTRERFFLIARRDGQPIVWPETTHTKSGEATLFGRKPKWKSARDHVIDWSDAGASIFNRKKPLSPNTLRRIYAGLAKFGGAPFLAMLYGTGEVRSVDDPAPTVTAQGNHEGLAQPFLVGAGGAQGSGKPHGVDRPMTTVLPHDRLALVQPFLLKVNGGEDKYTRASSIDEPAGAITTHPSISLVEPYLIPQQSGGAPRGVDHPSPTVSGAGAIALVKPVLLALKHTTDKGERVYDPDKPAPTITTRPDLGIAQPYLVKYYGTAEAAPIDEPCPTIASRDHLALAQPFLVEYHGANRPGGERVRSLDQPFPTVAAANQYALAIPGLDGYLLDIRFRMLKVEELAAAQGFDKSYRFTGTKADQKRQIGNAVPRHTAEALCYSQLLTL